MFGVLCFMPASCLYINTYCITFNVFILNQLSKESNRAKQLETELKNLQAQHADSLAQVKL